MTLRFTYAETLPLLLAVVLLGAWLVMMLFHVMAICYARFRLYRRVPIAAALSAMEKSLPGVSILKPLKGLESNVMSNLKTFFQLDYPRFELLFCLETDEDPIYCSLLMLKDQFPQVDAKILVRSKRVGVNPKVNNLIQGYQVAQYDLVLISDSGIRMKEDTLTDMVCVMQSSDRVGLVHQVPFVVQHEGFSNVLHTIYFGTWHAKMYVGSALLGINCTTGMSCLVRKDILNRAPNGLAFFGRYLAEDYFLAKHVYDEGFKVLISSQPALQDGTTDSVRHLRDRLMRWYKLRTAMLPHTVFLEPLSECFPSGALAAWSLSMLSAGAANPWVFFLCHCLVWFLLDYILLRQMLPTSELPCSKFELVCAWFFRELMSIPNQVQANCKREVRWRDKRYRIRWGGVTVELPPSNISVEDSLSNIISAPNASDAVCAALTTSGEKCAHLALEQTCGSGSVATASVSPTLHRLVAASASTVPFRASVSTGSAAALLLAPNHCQTQRHLNHYHHHQTSSSSLHDHSQLQQHNPPQAVYWQPTSSLLRHHRSVSYQQCSAITLS